MINFEKYLMMKIIVNFWSKKFLCGTLTPKTVDWTEMPYACTSEKNIFKTKKLYLLLPVLQNNNMIVGYSDYTWDSYKRFNNF